MLPETVNGCNKTAGQQGISMDIIYREYREGDFENLCRMVLTLYTEDPEGEPVTVDKIRLTVKEAERHPDKLTIIMFEHEATVIGYSILTFFWSNEHGGDIINIDEIFVKPAYRNQGIGTAFMNSLFERFPAAVALKLEVSLSNHRAKKGYERAGFTDAPNIHMIKSKKYREK
jgi:ribosomal protein S18 acetylase RimI-like enzyme